MKFLLAISFCISTFSVFAQPMGGMGRGMGGASQTGRFYGKVLDSTTNKPMDAVSVELIASKFDMAKRQRKDTILTGMLSQPNGDFSLENVPVMGDYRIRIMAIGYKTIEKKISFLTPEQQKKLMEAMMASGSMGGGQQGGDKAKAQPNMMETLKKVFGGDMSQLASLGDKDLGNYLLVPDAKVLENVTVTGNRPIMQMGIDRKIFNVDKSLAASGSSAIDIMRQIPSVNVDIDGNVTIRNSAPTLFVDGRPTTLTLDQIPADDIQSVELITNPSAKYDASGGTAAILNVVMKKNRKAGYNGSVRAGIDSRGKPNFGGDINARQGKVNVFASANLNQRKSLSWSDINTAYKASGSYPANTIAQDINSTNNGYFGFGRGGIDYFIDNRNTLTWSVNYMGGKFKTDETNNMRYDSFYNPVRTELGVRETESDRMMRNLGSSLSYKHNFAKTGHELTADVNFNQSKSDGESNYINQLYDIANVPKDRPTKQINNSNTHSTYVVAQTDYANKLNNGMKVEAGLRGQIRQFESSNNNYVYNYGLDDFLLVPSIASNYKYTDRVYAAYTTVTGTFDQNEKWGYNVGLRVESSDYNGELPNIDSSFSVQFPISLFPSAFMSYKLSDKSSLQMNYSRRINRPNFFQLMPYVDYTDPLNLQVGNPTLAPEFTSSLEANLSQQFNNNHSLLISAYYKYSDNLITRYQFKGLNRISKDSAIYNTWINANNAVSYGLELTSTNKFTKKFDATTNVNFYNASINSSNIKENLNNSQLSFFGKITLTQKAGKSNQWAFQVNGDYQSKTVLPVGGGGGRMGGGMGGGFYGGSQAAGSNGYVNPNYGMDVSVRRDIIKNKNGQGYAGSLTLSMNDVFRTRLYNATTASDFFVQNLQRRRDPQVLRLQFSWRFGKMDASLFKRKNMKGEMEGMGEGMNMQ